MKLAYVLVIALAIILASCSQNDPALDPQLHGQELPDEPNMPADEGEYAVSVDRVDYFEGTLGFLAEPVEDGDYPGVVMIHEWWGLNENIESMAELLASHGYRVLAVDLYEGELATDPSQAQALVSSFDAQRGVANMRAAQDYLESEGSERIASLGWCFGGAQSLSFSQASDLDATIIYYGNLDTDAQSLSSVSGPVLGIFGAQDSLIPVSSVESFNATLGELGIDREVYVYDGAGHAFANPSGDRYVEDAANDAWAKTVRFLDESLR